MLTGLFALGDTMTADGHELGGVVNTGDLGTEEVLFLTEIERVGHDVSLEVTREADLDGTCSFQVLGIEIGECNPIAMSLVGHEVGVLVDADATSLTTFGSFDLRQVLGFEDLTDVVILLSTGDFTPETKRTSLSLCGKLLERLR